jgi:hypothetical protein
MAYCKALDTLLPDPGPEGVLAVSLTTRLRGFDTLGRRNGRDCFSRGGEGGNGTSAASITAVLGIGSANLAFVVTILSPGMEDGMVRMVEDVWGVAGSLSGGEIVSLGSESAGVPISISGFIIRFLSEDGGD